MSKFNIKDGRESFWQWDVGQKLKLSDTSLYGKKINEVHISNSSTKGAYKCDIVDGEISIPDILLTTYGEIFVYAVYKDDTERETTLCQRFHIHQRKKPQDYIYTEPEKETWEELNDEIKSINDQLSEIPINELLAELADKAEITVVDSLPTTDIDENTIYLLKGSSGYVGYIRVGNEWSTFGGGSGGGKGEKGDKGDPGDSGVYIGKAEDMPDNANVLIDETAEDAVIIPNVLQELGDSEEDSISQKAVTDAINSVKKQIPTNTEEWTFTLTDGSTVVKMVLVR